MTRKLRVTCFSTILLVAALAGGGPLAGVGTAAGSCTDISISGNTQTTLSSSGCYNITNDVTDASLAPASVINVTAEDVIVRGNDHTIDGTGSGTAMHLVGPQDSTQNHRNITVRNLTITQFETGIEVKDAENVTVRNLTLEGGTSGQGLDFDGDSSGTDASPALNYNLVENTTIIGFGTGIRFVNTDRSRLEEVDIDSTASAGVDMNQFSSRNNISDVSVTDSGGTGMNIRSNQLINVTDSVVEGASGRGVYVHTDGSYYVNDSRIEEVLVLNTTQRGIDIDYAENLTVNATVVDNTTHTGASQKYHGIDATEARNLTITNSLITGAAADGINIEGPSSGREHLTIETVEATNNGDNGLSLFGNGLNGSRLADLNATGNTLDGIRLTEMGDVTLRNASATENNIGINLFSATRTTIVDSNASANDEDGIYNFDSDRTDIENTLANQNGVYGIEIYGSVGVEVTGSTTSDNDRGVRLTGDLEFSPATGTRIVDHSGVANTWAFEHAAAEMPPSNNTIRDSHVSVWFSNVRAREDTSPPANPDGYDNAFNHFEIERVSADFPAILNITRSYNDGVVSDFDESTLDYWYYNGSAWSEVDSSTVQTGNNIVSANLSLPGTYAVLAEPAESSGSSAEPAISVAPSSVDYGETNVSDTNRANVTVGNDGDANLTVEDISTTGDDAAVDPATTSFSLEPGETRNVTVTFTPTAGRAYDATLEIDSDDPDSPTTTVSLSGTGLAGTLSPDSDNVAFGNATVGTLAGRTLTLSNDGEAPVEITNASVDGSDADQFRVADAPTTLGVNESGNLSVAFEPTRTGPASATVTLETVGANETTTSLAVEGRGTRSVVDVTPTSYDFGTVGAGTTANTTVTVENNGSESVTLSSVTVGGANPGAFRADNETTTLDPGDRLNVSVTFAPSTGGNRSALLELRNGTGAAVSEVILTGRATAPELAVETTSLTFENATVGEQSVRNVTVSNTGERDLNVTGQTITPTDSDFELLTPVNGTLAPGESGTVTVGFEPTSRNTTYATLAITTNDPTDGTSVVYLSSGQVTATVSLNRTENTTDVTATVRNATAGESVSVSVPSEADDPASTDVEGISITPTRNTSFDLNVSVADERPPNASAFNATDSTEPAELSYLNVTHSIPNENISEATVQFRVNRSTMEEMESEPEDFSLYRRVNGTWDRVNTTLDRETNGSYVFSGMTTGLSEWTAATEVPRISVSDASANVTAVALDESVEIQVLLNNTGGSDGRFEVELLQNGTVVERRDVAVSPSTTSLVTFQRGFDQAGTYGIEVNDIFVAAIEVSAENESARVLDGRAGATGATSGGSGPLSPAVTAFTVLLTALVARRLDRSR